MFKVDKFLMFGNIEEECRSTTLENEINYE